MFSLSKEGVEFVKQELVRYETKRSAVIPCLYRVQKENSGWVSPEAVTYLSELMDIPQSWINEVLSFYTLFNKRPIGKLHVQVCTNISCSMNGGRELAKKIGEHFKVKPNETSADQRITLSCVECLGSCDTAPMMQVNDNYYEGLTAESAIKTLQELS